MNKYLMLTAAALLATGGNAYAASFAFGTARGGSYCDGGQITTVSGTPAAGWLHALDGGKGKKSSWGGGCSGGTSQGQGLTEKVKHLGAVLVVSDTVLGKEEGIFNTQLEYALPGKIKNGQPWTMWLGMNGTTSFEANSGVLVNVGANRIGARTAAVVKQLIRTSRERN